MKEEGLFIRKIILDRDAVESFEKYPFNVGIIKNFYELSFHSPVTFLIGENGIGKSTLIEAIAVSCGLNPEGGSQNFNFSTLDSHSNLSHYMTTVSGFKRPKTKFFLRAESFYNVASEIVRLNEDYGGLYRFYGGNLHHCSHGESFLSLVQNRFSDHGLYILDEPEAALSPTRQMTLLCLIDELVKGGSQFIIATHSPILISYRNGEILDLDHQMKVTEYQDTDIYQIYKTYLEDPDNIQRKLFDLEEMRKD